MTYKIKVLKNYFFGPHQFCTPGIYRVPEDMRPNTAETIIAQGFGERVATPLPEMKPAEKWAAQAPRRSYTRRKAAAPENKATVAEENKTDDDAPSEGIAEVE